MITALGPRLGLGLRLDFGSQVWFVQYFSEKKVIVVAPLWLALRVPCERQQIISNHVLSSCYPESPTRVGRFGDEYVEDSSNYRTVIFYDRLLSHKTILSVPLSTSSAPMKTPACSLPQLRVPFLSLFLTFSSMTLRQIVVLTPRR